MAIYIDFVFFLYTYFRYKIHKFDKYDQFFFIWSILGPLVVTNFIIFSISKKNLSSF